MSHMYLLVNRIGNKPWTTVRAGQRGALTKHQETIRDCIRHATAKRQRQSNDYYSHSVKGWTATNIETGERATAAFLDGKDVAIERGTPPKKKGEGYKEKEIEPSEASD